MKNLTFTALDFETATASRHSICQVGLVRVEQGKIVERISQLVQPPDNLYDWRNIQIHGIRPEDTEREPDFSQVWKTIRKHIRNQLVVAHNAAFDISCLNRALEYYALPVPPFSQACTYRLYGKKLSLLCEEYRIPLNHHDALSDAHACAVLFQQYLRKNPGFAAN